MSEHFQNPSSESHDPEHIGSILPDVIRDIERRELIGELFVEQQALFGSNDPAKQDRLQEIQDQIEHLSNNLEK